MSKALSVSDLSVSYGSTKALSDVHFELDKGSVCGLVGHNGSGKSTLMKAILDLIPTAQGTITIGQQTGTAARAAARIAYVPQSEDIDLSFPVTVQEVVTMGRFPHMGVLRRTRPADKAAIQAALEAVDLTDYADRSIGALSGGQRKRAFVARAIAQQAPIMLLDEPFAGVDSRTEAHITTILKDLAAAGTTLLISTHHLDHIDTLCDWVLLLSNRIVAAGTPADTMTTENLAGLLGRHA